MPFIYLSAVVWSAISGQSVTTLGTMVSDSDGLTCVINVPIDETDDANNNGLIQDDCSVVVF